MPGVCFISLTPALTSAIEINTRFNIRFNFFNIHLCAVQKNDGLGYAMFKVHEVECSVTALLRAPKDTGVLKSYPPGMYTRVEYCKLMPGVSFIF